MRRRSISTFVIGAALMLVASACGGGDDNGDGNGDDNASTVAGDFESPLGEALGLPDFSAAEISDREAAINDRIVACMAAEGFEYTPAQDNVVEFGEEAGADGLVWGSDEWVAKYGFGVSTQAFPQDMVGPALVGSPDFSFEEEEAFEDPNQAYLDTLTEAERQAYDEALYGNDTGPDITDDMTDEEIEAAIEEYQANFVPSGCQSEAFDESFGSIDQTAFFDEFGEELDALFENIENHPRVVEAEQEIANCVSDKGLSYTSIEDVYQTFSERMEPLYEVVFNSADEAQVPADEEDGAPLSEEELTEMFAPPALSDEAKAQLAEIQADELALAAAVNECGGGLDANQEVYEEVRIELEQQFVDDNRARIDDFRAAQEG